MKTKEEVVYIEELENIMHVRNGVTPWYNFVDEDSESNVQIVNSMVIEEESEYFIHSILNVSMVVHAPTR